MTLPADDPRLPILTARLVRSSASADIAAAGIHLNLGQLEDAERFAASAVRRQRGSPPARFAASAVRACDEGGYRRSHILAEILLAEVHSELARRGRKIAAIRI